MTLSQPYCSGIQAMLRKMLEKRLEEWITAGLLLLSTTLLQMFHSHISALTATISHTSLLLQLFAWSTISCGYLGCKFYRLKKSAKDKGVVRYEAGIRFRSGPTTGGKWVAFCPQCDVVLPDSWDAHFRKVQCLAGCGWSSTISPRELCDILDEGNK